MDAKDVCNETTACINNMNVYIGLHIASEMDAPPDGPVFERGILGVLSRHVTDGPKPDNPFVVRCSGTDTGGVLVACLKELYFPTIHDRFATEHTARDVCKAPLAILSATVNEFGEDTVFFPTDSSSADTSDSNACFVIEERRGTFSISNTENWHKVRIRPRGSTGPDIDGDGTMRTEYGWQRLETGCPRELHSGDIFEIRSAFTTHSPGVFMFVEGVSEDAIRRALGANRVGVDQGRGLYYDARRLAALYPRANPA